MKTKLLIRISAMLIVFAVCMQFAKAQIYASSQAEPFQFPNGANEWSDPVSFTLSSKKFKDKGLEPVPLQFRIIVKKKLLLACHFTVEVKNLSDKQGIAFEARNDYTTVDNKYVYHKVKLKPGATQTFNILYADLKCKIRNKEDCTTCGWNFTYVEVKPY